MVTLGQLRTISSDIKFIKTGVKVKPVRAGFGCGKVQTVRETVSGTVLSPVSETVSTAIDKSAGY